MFMTNRKNSFHHWHPWNIAVLGFVLAAVALTSIIGMAQTSADGSIRGHIVDASGGALVEVEVTAHSPNVGGTFRGITDAEGNYRLTDLPTGTDYTLTAEHKGFSRFERTGLVVQALFIEAYDLLSRNDPETLRILNDDILLLVPANPDGMELVSNWYMRESDPKKRNLSIPRLYQKYVGHDNNRDSYIANQVETENINRELYIDWIPQIMYNQHQTGPAGAVLFFSPFRDPFNYNQDPLVPIGIDLVGAAVHERFLAEDKPGAVLRAGAPYSTWFNGGDRTTTGFHNQIGLLSEIIGSPTPISIPLISSKLLPDGNQPAPIGPRQEWHQRQTIDYLLTADRAILDIASKFREDFLFRIYRAGKNSIDRGGRDNWTLTPKRIAAFEAIYAKDKAQAGKEAGEVRPVAATDDAYAREVVAHIERAPVARTDVARFICAEMFSTFCAFKVSNSCHYKLPIWL